MNTSTIPPCEATGPDGANVTIHPHATTDSIADLARAFDLPIDMPLVIDGHMVGGHERLVASGLRIGSAITAAPRRPDVTSSCPEFEGDEAMLEVAVGGGPACDRWIALGRGRHTVGRAAAADVRVDDPSVELHLGVIDVGPDGSATFTQLTGRNPVTVDGTPCAPRQPIGTDQVLRLGSSRLLVRTADGTSPASERGRVLPTSHDPWRWVVHRRPPASDPAIVTPVAVPEPPPTFRAPPLTSLFGAAVAAAGAGLMAAVLGQALFALFAAVGAVASLATWGVGAVVAWRDRRRADARHRAALAGFTASLRMSRDAAELAHRARHATVSDTLTLVHDAIGDVWWQRCGVAEPLVTTIGRGTCRWRLPIDGDDRRLLDGGLLVDLESCERLDDVAVPLLLPPASVIALRGDHRATAALARSLVVQLAVSYGPADWELLVVTARPDDWAWARWLPHTRAVVDARDAEGLASAIDLTGDTERAGRRPVIVLDAPDLLTARTGLLRRRLECGDAACIVIVDADSTVPSIADRILEVGETGVARWVETSGAWPSADRDIQVAGISAGTAEAAARLLAPLVDPEEHDDTAGLPTSLSLADLEPTGDDAAAVIVRRWHLAGRDPAPVARLGVSGDGIVDVDLVRDGPHGLVAGTTGSGKSELLRTLVVSLAAGVSPDHLTMILVDFKGGSTFDLCARLPHTVGVVTDLDEGLAERMLVSLDAEVRRRERLLRSVGADDLSAFRRAVDDPLPRLLVVVDEFASLAREHPEFLGALVSVAQRGRSLGLHLLLATQRPAGVVTDDIRANTNLRLALRLQDRSDAFDVVGDGRPAAFSLPGRAAMRLGPDELVVFQTATCSTPAVAGAGRLRVERSGPSHLAADTGPPAESVLERLVEVIRDAAASSRTVDPHRPWLDPLPSIVHRRDLVDDPAAVGVIDDPALQRRSVLRWAPDDGTLLLVGAVGAGTTTTAAAVVASCARNAEPGDLHLYVVDAQGDAAWTPFTGLAHCGAVVRVGEHERLERLLRRLADEIDRRSVDGSRTPSIVIVIDGMAGLRDALEAIDHHAAARRLDRVLRDGPAVGVVAVVTTDGSSSSALACARSVTWVLHVADPAITRSLGVTGAPVPSGIPGRLRIVGSGLEAQVAVDVDRPDVVGGPGGGGPVPIDVLPEWVDPDTLGDASDPERGDGPVGLLVGVAADDLRPAVLRVPSGDHVLVGGAARTGRSTALRQVEAAWRRRHPDGVVIAIDHRTGVGDAVDRVDGAGGAPVLVVVDDAERVDDPDGCLTALVSSHRPGVTVAAAARLDAVRAAYGHWTRAVARSRCGIVLTSVGDVDGELLGATLSRRTSIPPRPGLGWVIDHDGHRLVQVAARMRA